MTVGSAFWRADHPRYAIRGWAVNNKLIWTLHFEPMGANGLARAPELFDNRDLDMDFDVDEHLRFVGV